MLTNAPSPSRPGHPQVTRSLAPRSADRLYNLVTRKYFDDMRFFRVNGKVVQFGVNALKDMNRVIYPYVALPAYPSCSYASLFPLSMSHPKPGPLVPSPPFPPAPSIIMARVSFLRCWLFPSPPRSAYNRLRWARQVWLLVLISRSKAMKL